MATFIKGDLIILSVKSGATWLPVACLTSNSLSQTRNIIESQTKCDPEVIIRNKGSLSYELTFEGLYIDTTSATGDLTKASHDALKVIIEDTVNASEFWRMDTGITDTPFYYGSAIVSDLEMTAAAGDELVTFSGTLNGSGSIVTADPS